MKENPEKQFRPKDLTKEVLLLDGQSDIAPTLIYLKSIRRILEKFTKKGVLEKVKISHKHVLWKIKSD